MKKRAGEKCECGHPLPWHLVGIGPARMSHVCSCGRQWKSDNGPPKTFELEAEGVHNPFAEYDKAVKDGTLTVGVDWSAKESEGKTEVVLRDVPPERSPKIVWFYTEAKDAEQYSRGPYDTEEDAIAAARKEYDGVRDDFAVMKAEEVLVDAVAVAVATDVDQLLEMMEDHAADNCGNEDSIFSIADGHTAEEAEEVLEVLMAAWARKYLKCSWHAGIDVKTLQVHPPSGEPEYEELEE